MAERLSLDHTKSFQVRHCKLGIYQGRALDLAFWHPSSAMPEHGICRFSTREKAQALIDALCSSDCLEPMERADLWIEPYDVDEQERLNTDFPPPSAWETPT